MIAVGWRAWIVAGVLAAGLGLWGWQKIVIAGLERDVERAEAALADARTEIAAHETTIETLGRIAVQQTLAMAELEMQAAEAEARARALGRLREEARHAPAEMDGPVAPVLRRLLDGLRPAAAGGGGDPIPGPAAAP